MSVKRNRPLPKKCVKRDFQKHIKTNFDQPMRKLKRRLRRKAKLCRIFPRPLGLLRPVVRPPTAKYNIKTRLGKGFTYEELLNVGVNPRAARTIGIAFDIRRKNKSEESLSLNVARLKDYLSRLVVFSRKNKLQKGKYGIPDDTPREEIVNYENDRMMKYMPNNLPEIVIEKKTVTEDDKKFNAFEALRTAKWLTKKKYKRDNIEKLKKKRFEERQARRKKTADKKPETIKFKV